MLNRTVGAALSTVCLLFSVGCATSNLESRPEWARGSELPPDHPLSLKYAAPRYQAWIVIGTGKTDEEAVADAQDEAKKTVLGQVSDALGAILREKNNLPCGGSETEAYSKSRKAGVGEMADGALKLLEKPESWSGYDQETKYHYGLFVLDRHEFGRQNREALGPLGPALEKVPSEIRSGPDTYDRVTQALSRGLTSVLRLRVLSAAVRYGDGKTPVEPEALAQTEKEIVAAGLSWAKKWEALDTEKGLTQAHRLHQHLLTLLSKASLRSELARLATLLPCKNCKPFLSELARLKGEPAKIKAQLARNLNLIAAARTALKGVTAIHRIEGLRAHPHTFFKKRMGSVDPALKTLRNKWIREIMDLCLELESSEEKDMEIAFELLTGLRKLYKVKGLDDRILALRKRLPCKECGRTGLCARCKGKKRYLTACPTCKGTLSYLTVCASCKGDGRAICTTCKGAGRISSKCAECDKGEKVCDLCRGSGIARADKCTFCGATGQKKCIWCKATGKQRGDICITCNGRGYNLCTWCKGEGKQIRRCPPVRRCLNCLGKAVVTTRCRSCNSRGRSGTCTVCAGKKKVSVKCTRCKAGKVIVTCTRCNGKAICPLCMGRKHR